MDVREQLVQIGKPDGSVLQRRVDIVAAEFFHGSEYGYQLLLREIECIAVAGRDGREADFRETQLVKQVIPDGPDIRHPAGQGDPGAHRP